MEEVIDLVNSVIIFSISNDLTQVINFPTLIPNWDSHSPAFLDLFHSSDASICSTMDFPSLGNCDHLVVSVSVAFPSNSKWDALFHGIINDYSYADWDGLCDHLRDVSLNIFKFSSSAAASECCEWFQVGIDAYISHEYEVRPHSPPWFSAACVAAIACAITLLICTTKSSESKVKFRHASNCCKRVFVAAKLAYANRTKETITSKKLGSRDLCGEVIIFFWTKVNLLYLLYSTTWRCCLLHLINQSYLLKTVPRTLILTTQLFCYLSFSWNNSETA